LENLIALPLTRGDLIDQVFRELLAKQWRVLLWLFRVKVRRKQQLIRIIENIRIRLVELPVLINSSTCMVFV
jgi:hypothetical protein